MNLFDGEPFFVLSALGIHLSFRLRADRHSEHVLGLSSLAHLDIGEANDLGRLDRPSISHGDVLRSFEIRGPLGLTCRQVQFLGDAVQVCDCL